MKVLSIPKGFVKRIRKPPERRVNTSDTLENEDTEGYCEDKSDKIRNRLILDLTKVRTKLEVSRTYKPISR